MIRPGPYVAVVSARYRMLLQYRAAAFAGFTTQVFWGGIKLMVLGAFYAMRPQGQPMTLDEVIAYVWLGQALLSTLPWNVDGSLADEIRSGSVAYELLRPVDLYGLWFARTLAFRVATASLRSSMMLVFAMGFLPLVGLGDWALRPPPSLEAAALFGVSLVAMVALATSITMLMHVALVLTISGQGINYIVPSLVVVLSGMVLPLPLFPDWLQPLLELQPLRGLADVPFRIYAGNIVGTQALRDIAQQLVWAAVFALAGRAWLSSVVKRVVVHGG